MICLSDNIYSTIHGYLWLSMVIPHNSPFFETDLCLGKVLQPQPTNFARNQPRLRVRRAKRALFLGRRGRVAGGVGDVRGSLGEAAGRWRWAVGFRQLGNTPTKKWLLMVVNSG